jgi:hypothetical protein
MFLHLIVFNSLSPSHSPPHLMYFLLCACFSEIVFSSPASRSPIVMSLFGHHLLQPVQAHPRNLTGSDGRLRKNKRQKTNMQKAGVRWAGCCDGDTQQPPAPPASLLYTAANKRVEQQFLGGHDFVVIRNRGNL